MTPPSAAAPLGASRPRLLASTLLLVLGALAAALALSRTTLSGSPLVTSVRVVVALATPAALVLWRARGFARLGLLGLALQGSSYLLSGLVELPAEVNIDAFGRTSHSFEILLTALLCLLFVVSRRKTAIELDGALMLHLLATAFGGCHFVRNDREYYALLSLGALQLAAASLPYARRRPRRVLWIGGGLFFLAISTPTVFTTVSFADHLAGLGRIALALAPVLVVSFTSAFVRRSLDIARGLCAALLVGAAVGGVALLEAGSRIGFQLALGARLSLFGEHPNIIAPAFAAVAPISIALLARRSGRDRWLGVLTLSTCLAGMVLTRSRATLAAFAAAALATAFLLLLRRLRPALRPRVLAAGVTVALAATVLGVRQVEKQREAASLGESLRFRMYMWETALAAIRERPLLGYGFLTGDPLVSHARPSLLDGRSKDTHPHDVPLFVALGAGIPAAVIYVLLLSALLVVFGRRTLRAASRPEALWWASLLASGLALFTVQLVDQGLALHTPLSLHFGWLLALASLPSPHPRRQESTRGAAPGRLLTAALVLLAPAAYVELVPTAAERSLMLAQRRARAGEFRLAVRGAEEARRLWPHDLDQSLRAASILDRSHAPQAAVALLQDAARRHPLSARPWDELADLQWRLGKLEDAWVALGTARSLDPTGPLHAERSLQAARILLHLGRRGTAVQELARAFQADYTLLERIPWLEGADHEKFIYLEGAGEPIRLSCILEQNHRKMLDLCGKDVVRARRAASALTRGYIFLGRLDLARRAIRDFEETTGSHWLALDYLRHVIEQAEADRHRAASGAPSAAEGDRAATDSETDVEPDATLENAATLPPPSEERGQAGVLMGKARALLLKGDSAGAVRTARRALRAVYDVAAEREYVALTFDTLVEAYRRLGNLDAEREALEGALYFRPLPEHAVQRLVRVAGDFVQAHRYEEALDLYARAARQALHLPPSPAGLKTIGRFAHGLEPFLDPDPPAVDDSERARIRSRVARLLLDVRGSPVGELLEIRRLTRLGRQREARRRLERFQREHPAWTQR